MGVWVCTSPKRCIPNCHFTAIWLNHLLPPSSVRHIIGKDTTIACRDQTAVKNTSQTGDPRREQCEKCSKPWHELWNADWFIVHRDLCNDLHIITCNSSVHNWLAFHPTYTANNLDIKQIFPGSTSHGSSSSLTICVILEALNASTFWGISLRLGFPRC